MSIPIYRKIWEEAYGPIPVDESGKSFEIHHINGNHDDNRLENLACISIKEHFDIHWNQGDYMAAYAISRRMEWRPDINEIQRKALSEQARIAALKKVADGTHNFLGGKIQSAHQRRRKLNGTHNFVNSNPCRIINEDGTIETKVSVIDRQGNKHLISTTKYKSQLGHKSEWEYVTNSSIEGRKRLSSLQKSDNNT